jgi:nucleoside-triphosphatase
MSLKSAKILVTGLPGCGKTTAVMQIIEKLDCQKVAGFYTEEIREGDTRKGFRWIGLDGTSGVLAHVDIKGRFKVGRYGVDVAGFEGQVVPMLDLEKGAELFIIDEIGKMECLSGRFVGAVHRLFESDKSVLATVAQKGGGLISEVKRYPDVKFFTLKRGNFDKTIAEILEVLSF